MDSGTVLVAAGSDVYVLVAEGVPGNAVPAGVRVLDGVPITGVGVSVLNSNGAVGAAFFEQPAAIKINNTLINAPTDRIFFTFVSNKNVFFIHHRSLLMRGTAGLYILDKRRAISAAKIVKSA